MVKDKNTIQIKSRYLRHVNAKWIAKNYLEQFRVDPSWSIVGIIKTMRNNQEDDISWLKAWRARQIARRQFGTYS